jgi:hypothetical protein
VKRQLVEEMKIFVNDTSDSGLVTGIKDTYNSIMKRI